MVTGLGAREYLDARWPDDIAIIEAIAIEADEILFQQRKDQARLIANAVAKMLEKSG